MGRTFSVRLNLREQVDDQASEAIRSSKHGQILAASDRDSPITTTL
jgi:hypothetical protein